MEGILIHRHSGVTLGKCLIVTLLSGSLWALWGQDQAPPMLSLTYLGQWAGTFLKADGHGPEPVPLLGRFMPHSFWGLLAPTPCG